ncbi:ATP-dependent DNA ligase [Couchioplanes caeruleus]|uniref:ATP-dependent DNA ligase n=1 Tax=Couchioplanes caeruleus TaxID=56438 RepID=UPI0020BF1663|nr:ATP-dependent DNA ligase [Couchioplanes caeruleus]UQU68525.1 ATP-dependent DNA ligase [Couchioplanes caeruleus]
MRASGSAELPRASAGGVIYEPKWDGFRSIAWASDEGVRLQSRPGRDLSGYFPELSAALATCLPRRVVLDGELVIWDERAGRTSFDLLQRRFRAGRRVAVEAARHPAHFVAFDMLRDARGHELIDQPLSQRRRRLERLLASAGPEVTLCPQTADEAVAQSWLADWTASGVEGLVVKRSQSQYEPGRAGWIKVKTRHTEDCIVAGVTGTLERPVSLLLARFDDRGVLRFVGQTHRVRAERRPELAGMHLTSFSGEGSGHPWPRPLPAGWAADLTDRAALPYVPVEPLVVVEVDADIARDGPFGRFRHRCRFVRVRPDLQPSDLDRIVSQRPLVRGGV